MPVTLDVKAQLDLATAYGIGEEIYAIVKSSVLRGIRDGLREAAESAKLNNG